VCVQRLGSHVAEFKAAVGVYEGAHAACHQWLKDTLGQVTACDNCSGDDDQIIERTDTLAVSGDTKLC
jgi:hypothetical protein